MDGPGHAKCIIVEGRLLARVCEHESQADKVTSNTSKTSYFLLTTSSVVGAEGGDDWRGGSAPWAQSLPGSSPSGATDGRAPPEEQRLLNRLGRPVG